MTQLNLACLGTVNVHPYLLTAAKVAVAGFVLVKLRYYFKGPRFDVGTRAYGKVVVVTGANTGLGFELAKQLNLGGAKVYMLCRTMSRAQDARRELIKQGCDGSNLIILQVDMSSFSSVKKFVEEFKKIEPKFDVLINNAGCGWMPYEKSVDGYEMIWHSNHLGPFQLSHLLLPQLEKSGKGRIVNVSSKLHLSADSANFAFANDPKNYSTQMPYCRSKLAMTMTTKEMARKLHEQGSTVTVNSVHPGVFPTELHRHQVIYKTPIRQILFGMIWFITKNTYDAAQTPLYVALSEQVQGISGKYFSDLKVSKTHPSVSDAVACYDLYEESAKACGV